MPDITIRLSLWAFGDSQWKVCLLHHCLVVGVLLTPKKDSVFTTPSTDWDEIYHSEGDDRAQTTDGSSLTALNFYHDVHCQVCPCLG